jgi:hypothetical protein
VWVFCTSVNVELFEHFATHFSFGHHAANGELNNALRVTFLHALVWDFLQSTWVQGVVTVNLGVFFVARYGGLIGIDDHNVVTGVDVWRVLGLAFALKG